VDGTFGDFGSSADYLADVDVKSDELDYMKTLEEMGANAADQRAAFVASSAATAAVGRCWLTLSNPR